jgi:prevent-host-death family protein
MKKVPLSEVKDDLSRYLRDAETEEVVITRHGKPAGLLIGFETEEDWFDYRLEHDPRFLRRIEAARQSLRQGKGVRIEVLDQALGGAEPAPAPDAAGKAHRRNADPKRRRASSADRVRIARRPRG